VVDGIELSNYNIPLAELELVFRVNEDISIEDGVKDILKKCTVAPAVEIPDGRYDDWFPNISKYEVVANCAVAGAIVIGEEKTVTYDQIDNIKRSEERRVGKECRVRRAADSESEKR